MTHWFALVWNDDNTMVTGETQRQRSKVAERQDTFEVYGQGRTRIIELVEVTPEIAILLKRKDKQ